MAILLKNATLIDIDPPCVRQGTVRVVGEHIQDVTTGDDSPSSPIDPADEIIDCTDRLILPGLVVGHTHLYSALATGMPPPRNTPRNFVEILEEVWWKLDRALDDEAVYYSALVGSMRAALCGSSTLVDHHASPNAIAGSLGIVRDAMAKVGLRGVLCYEVTDRNGPEGTRSGIQENARFLSSCKRDGHFAGMVGAHASFTLGIESLGALADLAEQRNVGVHIHCAEDRADVDDCRKRFGRALIGHLRQERILRPGTLLVHCTHLTEDEIAVAHDYGCWTAHNPRSNMNNAVGYAPAAAMARGRVVLGTDGIDGDMWSESRAAFFKSRDSQRGPGIGECLGFLAESARFAGTCLNVPLGRIEKGFAADLVMLEYPQATPITTGNLLGHWFFGFHAGHVRSLMAAGRWVVRDRRIAAPGVEAEMDKARSVAHRVWEQFSSM
jgi:putative selenium metabolism protein SsnA